MWYELRALALANHNNYVIHMQTLCHSVIRDRISLAGFSGRGVIIFSFAEGKPWRFIRDLGARGGEAAFEVTHVEGMLVPLGSGSGGEGRVQPGTAACWTAASGS